MRVVLQRVSSASVAIDGIVHGSIEEGLMLLVGFGAHDHDIAAEEIDYIAKKVVNCRIFADEDDKLNLSVKDVTGAILSISQFTLYANTKKGNRPSFTHAQAPELAKANYERFNTCLADNGVKVVTGVFGANMQVELVNDGPVTIVYDTDNK